MNDKRRNLKELGDALHKRFLAERGDVVAEDISKVFLPPLVAALKRKFRHLHDPDLAETVSIDSLLHYFNAPEKFRPEKGSLIGYLYMDASRDLMTLLQRYRTKVEREIPLSGAEDIYDARVDVLEQQISRSSALMNRLETLITDPIDREVIDLMIEGVRGTEAYVDPLGLRDLPREEQSVIVRRHKDRLKRRLQRALRTLLHDTPEVLLQSVIVPGEKGQDGQLIEAVTFPWFEIIKLIERDPQLIYDIDWRKWEEIIAGAYKQWGFDVILTPRSNDKGRDIIATRSGIGCIRFFDQVKAYRPGHLVTADEVRAMVGVLTLEANVSKGIITTTSHFAPGIFKDESIQRFTPYRLELKAKEQLLDWLGSTVRGRP